MDLQENVTIYGKVVSLKTKPLPDGTVMTHAKIMCGTEEYVAAWHDSEKARGLQMNQEYTFIGPIKQTGKLTYIAEPTFSDGATTPVPPQADATNSTVSQAAPVKSSATSKVVIAILATVLILLVIGGLIAMGKRDNDKTDDAPTPTPTQVQEKEEEPTLKPTDQPTATPSPTATPEPTATPNATATPTPTPSTSAQ